MRRSLGAKSSQTSLRQSSHEAQLSPIHDATSVGFCSTPARANGGIAGEVSPNGLSQVENCLGFFSNTWYFVVGYGTNDLGMWGKPVSSAVDIGNEPRTIMTNAIQHQLVAGLLLWSLASLGTATIGLYARPREFWRSFWFMSGLWGLIDGGIAWFSLLGERRLPAELLPILRFNTGLDVLYLVVAGILLSRKKPLLRGFGLGVFMQGAFLLLFDGYFWWRCVGAMG